MERGSRGDRAFGLSLGLEGRLGPAPWAPSSLPWPEALLPPPLSPQPLAHHSAVRPSPWNRFRHLCHNFAGKIDSLNLDTGGLTPSHTKDSCKVSWLVNRNHVMFGILVIRRGNAFSYLSYLFVIYQSPPVYLPSIIYLCFPLLHSSQEWDGCVLS